MENNDIRWKQRLVNYNKVLAQLQLFVEKGVAMNKLEIQGMIKSFEYTYELAWNLIKDYYEFQGETPIQGSRDAFRLAFNRELIEDGETWMKMIESRIKTAHTYNQGSADEIADEITHRYFDLFLSLQKRMEELKSGKQDGLF